MKNYFIAILLLLCSFQTQARYVTIGIGGGAGAFFNSNDVASFPGLQAFGTGGMELGFMANKHFGVISGVHISHYNFIITSGSYVMGRQSITTTDVPLCFRYVVTKNKLVKFYMQPGLVFAFTSKAHFTPEGVNPNDHTVHYEADNNYDFNPMTVRPVLGLGFMFKMSRAVYFNLGWEVSAAGQNAVKRDEGTTNTNIQEHNTKMAFSYAAMKMGLQFRFGYGN